MKKKIIWFIIFALLIVVIVVASIFINKKGLEMLGSEQTNMINENKEEESMNVIKVNDNNFEEEVLKSNIPVLVDFYADWCGPCRMMSPVIDDIAKELEGTVKVGKVNVDSNQELAIKYDVMSIPTIMVFEKGNPIKTFVGVTDKQEILEVLK